MTSSFEKQRRKAVLVLKSGKIYPGWGIGATGKVSGEVVFNTLTAAGFNHAITTPSSSGQILTFTSALVGAYGVPAWEDEKSLDKNFESPAIQCGGVVVNEAVQEPSHYMSTRNFSAFLEEEGIPGIENVDTRAITTLIHDYGVQLGILAVFDPGIEPNLEALRKEAQDLELNANSSLVERVSTKETKVFNPAGKKSVVLLDCGVRNSTLLSLIHRDCKVTCVPFDTSAAQISELKPDGVFLSSGPEQLDHIPKTVQTVRELLEKGIPLFGNELGHLILGAAAGCDITRLPFGHRGSNKPSVQATTNRCYATSQSHDFVIKEESLKSSGFNLLFSHADDGSIEGMKHSSKPAMSVQFHAGSRDTGFLFDEFIKMMEGSQ